MSISVRIFGGFLAVLLLATMIAAVGWRSLDDFARRAGAALAAQDAAADIDALLAAGRKFIVAGAGRGTEEDEARRAAAAAAAAVDRLARMPGTEAAAARLRQATMAFNADFAAYVDQERQKAGLTAERRAALDGLGQVAAAVAPAQEKNVAAAQAALSAAREVEKKLAPAEQILALAVRNVGDLKAAQARLEMGDAETRPAAAALADGVGRMAGILGSRLPMGVQAQPMAAAAQNYRALADRGASAVDLAQAAERLAAAVTTLGQELGNVRSRLAQEADDAADRLDRAWRLRAAALTALAEVGRAGGAEAALTAGTVEGAALTDAVAGLADAVGLLLYWTVEDAPRNALKAMEKRIAGYGDNLRRFDEAVRAQRDYARRFEGSSAQAAAAARAVRDAEMTALMEEGAAARWRLGAGVTAALLLGTALAYWIGRGVTRPLAAIVAAMRRLAAGDVSGEIPGRDRRDELRDVAAAVTVFRDNAREMARLGGEQERLKREAEDERRATMDGLADAFDRTMDGAVGAIAEAARTLHDAAEGLSANAAGALKETATVADAAQRASTDIRAVAASSQQLAASVAEISARVGDSSRITEAAVGEAQGANARVEELAAAAEQIGGVVALIQAVAAQTNLLALNATIEAARAGEMGKGFAVVASEVKGLAGQTAAATEDIAVRVQAIQRGAAETAEAIRAIGDTVGRVSAATAAISAAVTEQTAATAEISASVRRIADGAAEIAQGAATVNRISADAESSAGGLLQVSDELGARTAALEQAAATFLHGVRTA